MTIQDLGSIGELLAAVATIARLCTSPGNYGRTLPPCKVIPGERTGQLRRL